MTATIAHAPTAAVGRSYTDPCELHYTLEKAAVQLGALSDGLSEKSTRDPEVARFVVELVATISKSAFEEVYFMAGANFWRSDAQALAEAGYEVLATINTLAVGYMEDRGPDLGISDKQLLCALITDRCEDLLKRVRSQTLEEMCNDESVRWCQPKTLRDSAVGA